MNGNQNAGRAALVAAILLWGGLLLPIVSLNAAAARNTNITTVSVADICPNFTAPSQLSVPTLTFTISDSGNNEDLTRASITYNGTNLSDIKAARLYRESANNGGTFNMATDVLLGSNTSIADNVIVIDLSYRLTKNQDRQFYVVFDIGDNATDGNRVDARIDLDMLTVQGKTWPDVVWDPAGSAMIETSPPGNWSAFAPVNWSNSRTVNCSVNVSDWRSGLRVSSAEYQFSNDSGGNWSNWRPAACTGANETTANQTITARSVSFANDSAAANLIRFRIMDAAGNLGTSPNHTVRIDSTPPSGWLLRFPLDWYGPDQRPAVQVAVSDNLSGLDIDAVSADHSVDGGGNWTPVPSVNCSGSKGSLYLENVTAWSVPFDRDSATQNVIRFNVSDLAGSWNRSPAFVIKIDATPPDAPALLELPRFANGTSRIVAWNATPDPLSGLDRFLAVCDDASDLSSPEQTIETNETTCVFTNLTDGLTYYYGVAASDLAGNFGNFSPARNCTQDASSPVTTLVPVPTIPNGANGWYTGAVNISFEARDNTSGVAWTESSLDGGPFTKGASLLIQTDGTHNITFRSGDVVGNVEGPSSVTVNIDTVPPVARIVMPRIAYVNETVQFDGSGSTDAVSYLWDFGDRTNATDATTDHRYTQTGPFRVSLTVCDRAGLTCSTIGYIDIRSPDDDYRPVAVIGQLGTLYVGVAATFSGAGSTDEEPATLTFLWSFGDGTTATGVTAAHVYSKEGDYNITLKVTDRTGQSDIESRPVRVYGNENKPPLAYIAPINVAYTSESVGLDGSNSADEDLPNCTFRWDFGDGTTQEGIRLDTVSHTFNSAGNFTVRLTVTDKADLSGQAHRSFMVIPRDVNLGPVVQFIHQPLQPRAGKGIEFDASNTWDERPETLNFTWNFGDGSVAHGKIVTHSYSSKGTYKVTLWARDDREQTKDFNNYVTVTGPEKPVPSSFNWTPYMLLVLVLMMVAAIVGIAASRRRRPEPAHLPAKEEEPHAPEGPQSLVAPTPVTHTQAEVVIEEGLNYLIDRESPDTAYTTLSKLAAEGASAMLVSPVHPNKINKSYNMENVEIFWLSDVTGETPSIDPSKMEYELAEKIITFIKEKEANAVVLLDGLELLVQGHSFDKVMEFIHTITEVASVNGATVLVYVNGRAFKEVELNQLKRKFDRW